MQQWEQGASRDVLGYDGELARVVQTRAHKLDDARVVEAAEDGDLSAEHVHVRLWAVGVGTVPADEKEQWRIPHFFAKGWEKKAELEIW